MIQVVVPVLYITYLVLVTSQSSVVLLLVVSNCGVKFSSVSQSDGLIVDTALIILLLFSLL